MTRTLRTAATAGVVLAAALGTGVGSAQAAPTGPGCKPAGAGNTNNNGNGNNPAYPPGNSGNRCKKAISDRTLDPGQSVTANSDSGAFDGGSPVAVGIRSTYRPLGSTTAASDGAGVATFTIPADMEPGSHTVSFSGTRNGVATTTTFPVTVSGTFGSGEVSGGSTTATNGSRTLGSGSLSSGGTTSAGGGASAGGSTAGALPFTGDSTGQIALLGGALVAAGAGSVVVARRRRHGAA